MQGQAEKLSHGRLTFADIIDKLLISPGCSGLREQPQTNYNLTILMACRHLSAARAEDKKYEHYLSTNKKPKKKKTRVFKTQ